MRPFRFGSIAEPKMMFASSATSSRMRLAAWSTSNRVRSSPPVMLISSPRAPPIDVSSSRGLEIAPSAAAMARFSPSASPVPIMALPISAMTVRMSAKSRLTSPGAIIRSVTPRTPMYRTLSAILNASCQLVRSLASRKRFWLGMTMSVSTNCWSSAIPASADLARRPPSKVKGFVTTPTVRMPRSRAMRAMTGAAPVPVPPPMPAVMKIMCAPSRWRDSSSHASSAAARPISGFAPAPRPCVRWGPSWMRRSALLWDSCCASVLATTNSTPCSCMLIMLSTALVPPPPTPNTVMRGVKSEWFCCGMVRFRVMVGSRRRGMDGWGRALCACLSGIK
ncbi:hypothetical protein KMAL_27910 [Novacetimonas maltaceti]|uniref:Uncharacterized protein n=1 Tax=Novacetimonas maltaceti TaxID=1203393 RepID=A0A2S3VYB3_9PROT|nr:hypothetical protein KMAL_27910 [Novacetimonas maltaceti]